jgi:hypothetical protein
MFEMKLGTHMMMKLVRLSFGCFHLLMISGIKKKIQAETAVEVRDFGEASH